MLTNGSQCIFTAAFLVLVENDDISDIEHLNLLKLSVSSKLCRHHVERTVGHRCDGVAALTNSAGLTEDEVKANRLGDLNRSVKIRTDL